MTAKSEKKKYHKSQVDFLNDNINIGLKYLNLPFVLRLLASALLVIFALLFRLYLNQFSSDEPFLLFFAAIIICAWFFGLRAGIFATLLSAILIKYFLVELTESFYFAIEGDIIMFLIFVLLGMVISKFISLMRQALEYSELQRHKILKNEKQFRLMIEGISEYAIYSLDPEGFIVNWNEGAQRMKGFTKDDIIGKHFSMFYTNDEIAMRKPWTDLEEAKIKGKFEDEKWRVKKDGEKFWGHHILNAIYDDEGKLEGFVTVVQDMTQRKLQEQQKDNFISIASHELKTPITSIKAYTQLMQKHFKDEGDKKSTNFLTRMDSQLNKLTKLIEDLLDVSRISQGRLEYNEEVFRFDDLVNEVVDEVQVMSSSHKIIKQGRATALVLADKYRVGQVLTNLLTNAVKYSPNAKKVEIKTSVTKEGVLVSVRDYGIGIPKNQQNRIFERFFRAQGNQRESFPGLGLGLFISAEIMKRHGGKMWFESHEGKGSTFYFLLPITLREKLIKQDLKNSS